MSIIRVPNTSSTQEVKKAFQKLKITSADHSAEITTLTTDITSIDERLSTLEDTVDFVYSGEADEAIAAGQPVYVKSTGHVGLAKANNLLTQNVAGLATSGVALAHSLLYNTDGRLQLDDWSEVTGTTLLVPGSIYFLSDSDYGTMTISPPTQIGSYVIRIGKAVSFVIMDIEISQSVLL